MPAWYLKQLPKGGLPVFLALYQEAQPDYIGPVRSARPYYLHWVLPFDAGYAHVGGSPEARKQIKSLGIKDLDEFANPGAYERVTKRYAPHNVYTSREKLLDLQRSKGFGSSSFISFIRKLEAPRATPKVRKIDINISGFLYNVHYDYDSKTNNYRRSMGGKAHIDERSRDQITPKVVIVLVMQKGIASDGVHTTYKTTGGGAMFIFQDGGITKGIWKKRDAKSQFKFVDSQGKALALNPGQTWISVVGQAGSVAYRY